MGIFSRLADIINANLATLLDRAEDPEKMIRLMIQEMEDTLVEVRATAAKAIADKKEVRRSLERLGAAQGEWQRKAELALARGRDDLAKGALMEKARLAETAAALAHERSLLDDALAHHDEDVRKLESKLREAKAKQKAMLARGEAVGARLKTRRQLHDKRIDDAFARFAQMERRLDAAEGEVESYDLGRTKTLSEEIAELEAEATIEDELARLKARLAKPGDDEGRRR